MTERFYKIKLDYAGYPIFYEYRNGKIWKSVDAYLLMHCKNSFNGFFRF